MSDIALSSSERANLLLLQRVAAARGDAANRLSTGQRVNSAVDDPVDFFAANSLQNRVADLLNAKDDIGQGLSAIEATLDGLDALSTLSEQLQGIASSALGGTDAQRAAAAQQFDTLRAQFDALAADVSFGGTQLLSSDDRNVTINDRGTTQAIEGVAIDSASLGLGSAASDYNGFATDADIQSALSALTSVDTSLQSNAQTFGGNIAALTIREEFNTQLGNTLTLGAQRLVEADLGEEAATLLAADVRDRLGLNGLQVAQQNAALIADLVGGT